RLKPYHRLDLSAIYTPTPKRKKKLESYWVFSLYNTYSRMNPYFVYFNQSGNAANGTLKIEARQVSLFPLLPSVTWNFKF
ncbi:MAG: TonB-dependent receptor, partial [Flavisolibacter sp.]